MSLKEVENQIKKVREYIKDNFLDEALSLMQNIISDKECATNEMVMLEMGQVFLAKENFLESQIWFKKVLDQNKENIYAVKAMLRVSYNLEDYENVFVYLKKIIHEREKFQNDLSDMINFLFIKLFKYKETDDGNKIRSIINILVFCNEYIKDYKLKNILINELEILNKEVVLKSKPRVAVISMTSRCNIKCKMCKIPSEHWDFPNNKKQEIFNLFPSLQKVIWHGGEPFLYPDIDDMIVEAGKHGVNQVISTNGLLLSEERIKKIVNSKMELNISIHGLEKEVYESIHCGGKFDLLLKNLETIKEIIDQSKLYMKYGIKFLLMKSNYKHLNKLYDFALKYGFNHVYVNTLGYDTINEENFIYHYQDTGIIQNVIENSKILSEKFKRANILYEAWLPELCEQKNEVKQEEESVIETKFCCYMPWQSIVINTDGVVQNNCYCENLILGNINKDSIDHIWNNNKIIEIRKNIIKNGFDEKCSLDCKNKRISSSFLKNPVG